MKINNLHIPVRFNDCDLMGHVNNAIYLTYIEEARIHFFNQILPKKWDWNKNGIIVKKHEIIYHEQLLFGELIEISSSIGYIGSSSFEIQHEIKVNDKIKTSVNTILVYFDYKFKKTKPLNFEILKYLKNE
jgi:acyl-CoA thioester hydrolase